MAIFLSLHREFCGVSVAVQCYFGPLCSESMCVGLSCFGGLVIDFLIGKSGYLLSQTFTLLMGEEGDVRKFYQEMK